MRKASKEFLKALRNSARARRLRSTSETLGHTGFATSRRSYASAQGSSARLAENSDQIDQLRRAMPALATGPYRHFKGGVYWVLGIAVHSETEEAHVIYCDATTTASDRPRYWVRPMSMFIEPVEVHGRWVPRFAPLEQVVVPEPPTSASPPRAPGQPEPIGRPREPDSSAKRHAVPAVPVELTTEVVEALQRSTRSRTLTCLCRAYLQFGSDAMSSDDLDRLRAAIGKRKAP